MGRVGGLPRGRMCPETDLLDDVDAAARKHDGGEEAWRDHGHRAVTVFHRLELLWRSKLIEMMSSHAI